MRRQTVPPLLVYRVRDFKAIQKGVKIGAIVRQRIRAAARRGEGRAVGSAGQKGVDIGLDPGRDGDGPPLPRFRLDPADEGALFGAVVAHGEGQERGGTKAEVTVAQNELRRSVARFGGFAHGLQLASGEAGLPCPALGVDLQELREVSVLGHAVARNAVFIYKPKDSLCIFFRPFAKIGIVQAVLQVVDIEVGHGDEPQRREELKAAAVAVHCALSLVVRRLPLVIELLEADPLPLAGCHGGVNRAAVRGGQERQRGQSLGARFEAAGDNNAALVGLRVRRRARRQRVHFIAEGFLRLPASIRKLRDAALPVRAGAPALFADLLSPAPAAPDRAVRQLAGAFRIIAGHGIFYRPKSDLRDISARRVFLYSPRRLFLLQDETCLSTKSPIQEGQARQGLFLLVF